VVTPGNCAQKLENMAVAAGISPGSLLHDVETSLSRVVMAA
jgi:hypothetical protein